MPTVFLTQETKRNVEKAARFGELKPVLGEGHSFVDDNRGANDQVLQILGREFSSRTDYVLPVGDLVGVFAAGFFLGIVNREAPVRLLKWDARLNDYVAVEITA